MKKLSPKEEEILRFFWKNKELSVAQLRAKQLSPKPHLNTLSTYVRSLEKKGVLSHRAMQKTYIYFSVISEEDYKILMLKSLIKKYFNNSSLLLVKHIVNMGKITKKHLFLIEQEHNLISVE